MINEVENSVGKGLFNRKKRGVDHYSVPRWKSTFEIKSYFEEKMGKSIYDALKGVREVTFKQL